MFRVWKWCRYESLIHLSECRSRYISLNSCSCWAISICRQYGTKLTHYEVLGIAREATAEDIRAAFIKKSKECHPDINRNDPNNHKRFILVNEAYSVLSKPPLRRDYDVTTTHHQVNEHNRAQKSRAYYYSHRSAEYYDEQIRNASNIRDEDDKKHSPNAAKRHKFSNSMIVACCVLWLFAGITIHYYVISKSTALHLKTLEERDARIREMWSNAKKQAEIYPAEDQIIMLLQKQQENARKLNGRK